MKRFSDLVREEVRDLPLYVPGKPIDEVKRELGLAQVIKLASNENPYGPSPMALAAMHEALPEIHRYPDANAYVLKEALASSLGLTPGNFLLGNGSEEIVQMIAKAFFRPGDEIIMGTPSFPRYETVARLMGAVPVEVPLAEGYYPLNGIIEKISSQTRAIFICNPNNPTGTALTALELQAFVELVPPHILLVFDEAYYEFADQLKSGLDFMEEERPLIVLRTFSKAYGLAGIRLGFAIAEPELIEALNKVREPFNGNAVALAGALAAWQDQAHLQMVVEKNNAERSRLTKALEDMGFRVLPSATNFVLAFLEQMPAGLNHELLRRGIIVRSGIALGYPEALRISVGTQEENDKLLTVLAEILNQSY